MQPCPLHGLTSTYRNRTVPAHRSTPFPSLPLHTRLCCAQCKARLRAVFVTPRLLQEEERHSAIAGLTC
jgi:hypothetical protein